MTKVLFVTSEAVPYIKTGGLADVAGSLPRYFNKKKYDVRIIVPKYACMDDMYKLGLKFHSHFYISLGWRNQYVGILETVYEGIHYYFIDNEFYFAGPQPYHALHEDIEKFAFFSKAALVATEVIGFSPDIIHCHDWQTGMVPVFLKAFLPEFPGLAKAKTIMTIHNLRFQGRWMIDAIKNLTDLPDDYFTPDKLEIYGESSFLKGGIAMADAVTTVSPTYADEITTPEGGEGFDGLLKSRRDEGRLYGIINGLDVQDFNPATDPYIYKNFDSTDWKKGKEANKVALQKELGLPVDKDCCMIGWISRLTNQKGFDLLAYVMDELMSGTRVQLVILGTGEKEYVDMLKYFQDKYSDKLSVNVYYSEGMAHKIYASVDAFLMPSLFEPCGLSQLMSFRYGTIPIVRETGGLKDTVLAYNEYDKTGSGFSFANFNAHEMLGVIYYALKIYYENREDWDKMAERDMGLDYSWKSSARQYEKLYDSLLI